MTTKTI